MHPAGQPAGVRRNVSRRPRPPILHVVAFYDSFGEDYTEPLDEDSAFGCGYNKHSLTPDSATP